MSSRFIADEKGQEFEPFRMLIAAVMALVVLMIIIGAINYFNGLRVNVSKQRFYDGLENAVRQPNGQPFKIENLQFLRGDAFSAKGLGNIMGLPEGCVSFVDKGTPAVEVGPSSATILQEMIGEVIAVCSPGTTCEVECEITIQPAEP